MSYFFCAVLIQPSCDMSVRVFIRFDDDDMGINMFTMLGTGTVAPDFTINVHLR